MDMVKVAHSHTHIRAHTLSNNLYHLLWCVVFGVITLKLLPTYFSLIIVRQCLAFSSPLLSFALVAPIIIFFSFVPVLQQAEKKTTKREKNEKRRKKAAQQHCYYKIKWHHFSSSQWWNCVCGSQIACVVQGIYFLYFTFAFNVAAAVS